MCEHFSGFFHSQELVNNIHIRISQFAELVRAWKTARTFVSTFFSFSFVLKIKTWKTVKINRINLHDIVQHGLTVSWICTVHMNIDRRYVVLLCWFAFSFYFNLYNHQNTTDVFFLTMIMTHMEQNVNKLF